MKKNFVSVVATKDGHTKYWFHYILTFTASYQQFHCF